MSDVDEKQATGSNSRLVLTAQGAHRAIKMERCLWQVDVNRLFGKWQAVAFERDLKAAKCTRCRLTRPCKMRAVNE
jgi:hypothetical protein